MIIGEDKTLITKDELKRLKKALNDKNEKKILDWAREFECQVDQKHKRIYREELGVAIDNFILTIVYTLRYNECTKFGNKRISDFMEDLLETIGMFRRGEAVPDDYRKQLEDDKIIVKGRDN